MNSYERQYGSFDFSKCDEDISTFTIRRKSNGVAICNIESFAW